MKITDKLLDAITSVTAMAMATQLPSLLWPLWLYFSVALFICMRGLFKLFSTRPDWTPQTVHKLQKVFESHYPTDRHLAADVGLDCVQLGVAMVVDPLLGAIVFGRYIFRWATYFVAKHLTRTYVISD